MLPVQESTEDLQEKLTIATQALREIAEASDLTDIKSMFHMHRTALNALRRITPPKDDQHTLL